MRDSMVTIDLNADVGEGLPGTDDVALLGYVTSANVACGGHAGSVETMRATVDAALARGVTIGAHPSFVDREHFGRREMRLPLSEIVQVVTVQLQALADVARAAGARVHHVKPHGALYNMAARDQALAQALAEAVRTFDARLVLVGLAGSALVAGADAAGLASASEGFADRAYARDGTLVPRTTHGAVVTDEAQVVRQAISMAADGTVVALTGETVRVRVDTLCVHSDTPGAAHLAGALRRGLRAAGMEVRSFGARSRGADET